MGPLRSRNTNVSPVPGHKADALTPPSSQGVAAAPLPHAPRSRSCSPPPATSSMGTDPWATAEVRELVLENERMLVELVAFQELGTAYARKRIDLLFESEKSQRSALEALYWQSQCTLLWAAHGERSRIVEKALEAAAAANDELRGFMALAQDALDPDDDVARRLSISSPSTKRRRHEDGSADTPSPGDTSSGKKRARTSAQKSPAHLTHMRKTLQPDKLPATLSVKRGDSLSTSTGATLHS